LSEISPPGKKKQLRLSIGGGDRVEGGEKKKLPARGHTVWGAPPRRGREKKVFLEGLHPRGPRAWLSRRGENKSDWGTPRGGTKDKGQNKKHRNRNDLGAEREGRLKPHVFGKLRGRGAKTSLANNSAHPGKGLALREKKKFEGRAGGGEQKRFALVFSPAGPGKNRRKKRMGSGGGGDFSGPEKHNRGPRLENFVVPKKSKNKQKNSPIKENWGFLKRGAGGWSLGEKKKTNAWPVGRNGGSHARKMLQIPK